MSQKELLCVFYSQVGPNYSEEFCSLLFHPEKPHVESLIQEIEVKSKVLSRGCSISVLSQGLTKLPKKPSNLEPSCFSLLSSWDLQVCATIFFMYCYSIYIIKSLISLQQFKSLSAYYSQCFPRYPTYIENIFPTLWVCFSSLGCSVLLYC